MLLGELRNFLWDVCAWVLAAETAWCCGLKRPSMHFLGDTGWLEHKPPSSRCTHLGRVDLPYSFIYFLVQSLHPQQAVHYFIYRRRLLVDVWCFLNLPVNDTFFESSFVLTQAYPFFISLWYISHKFVCVQCNICTNLVTNLIFLSYMVTVLGNSDQKPTACFLHPGRGVSGFVCVPRPHREWQQC